MERRLDRIAAAIRVRSAKPPMDLRMFSDAQIDRLADIAERVRAHAVTIEMLPADDLEFLEAMDALRQRGTSGSSLTVDG